MALTFSTVARFVAGDREVAVVDVTFDSSYPLGGEAVTAGDLGFDNSITAVIPGLARDPDTADNAVALDFDASASTLVAFWSNSDAADGPLIEVPATTSLAAYTARVVAIGK